MEWYKIIAIGFLSVILAFVVFFIYEFILIWFEQFKKK
jgi:hypothetical protein